VFAAVVSLATASVAALGPPLPSPSPKILDGTAASVLRPLPAATDTMVRTLGARTPSYSSVGVYITGLPPNFRAPVTFASWGPHGGWWEGGDAGDGFDFGGSLGNGNYTLVALPSVNSSPYRYIPYPASATYFVTNNSSLNITINFLPAFPCFQTFTEVGLPFGSEWWVIEGDGLAFFSNGSIIDAIGCPASGGVSIGSATDYRVLAFPTSTFYPQGASIPVAFGPPPTAPSFAVSPSEVALVGIIVGLVLVVAHQLESRPPRPPRGPAQPAPAYRNE